MAELIEQPVAPSVTENKKPSRWTIQRMVLIAAGGLGGIIVLLFVVGLAFALFSDVQVTAPRIQIVRDTLITILSLEFILIVGAFAVLVLQIVRLVILLQSEMKPVLTNTQEVVSNAKGTVEFVGNTVAEPVVRVGSFLAGASIFIREVGGIRRAIRREEKEEESEPVE
jgi:hypothetical protein